VNERPDDGQIEGRKGEEQERSSRPPEDNRGAVYQGAFEAVMAILIAGFAGKLADDYFGTEPRYLLLGFAIGFGSFVLRLVRLGRALQGTTERDDSEEQ